MRNFKKRLKELLYEENILLIDKFTTPNHEELCRIFNVDEVLTEDKADNEAWIYLACNYYKRLLDLLKHGNIDPIEEDIFEVQLDDLKIKIYQGKRGNYNYSNYNPDSKELVLYTSDMHNVDHDYLFRNSFIHEITHYLSEHENDNTMPWNYTKVDEDLGKYYTQPTELLAYKVSICHFIVNEIQYDILHSMHKEDWIDSENLRKRIEKYINKLTAAKGFIFHDFLVALSKDKKVFKEFYEEVVDTCIDEIKNHLYECRIYTVYNEIKEDMRKEF